MNWRVNFKVGFIIFFLGCFLHVNAQEMLLPLRDNPAIKQYLKEHPADHSMLRVAALDDTLPLPFVDDFSYQGIYPSENLWLDSNVFINSTYCDKPVTIGVATFDGINKYGNPYNPNSVTMDSDPADTLTSKPINLFFPNDPTIWFSFYYQPQGLGDEPQDIDSLYLEFKNSSGLWNVVWTVRGRSDSAFKRINIHITDTNYQYKGFQFRFLNYATINGNRDHWNIDYVWLGLNRTDNDSLLDISLVNPIKSYLKEFTAMPYSHYKHLLGLGTNPVVSQVIDLVRCFKLTGTTTITMKSRITDMAGAIVFDTAFIREQGSSFNAFSNADFADTAQIRSFVFPSDPSLEFADFKVRHFYNATLSLSTNDTSYRVQHFQNYYALDDGTAELSYGNPEEGAKIAYRFNIKMRDTLRGVQIYFNQVGDLVHNELFQLCYWDVINPTSNTEHLVHSTINQKPANIDSINGFATYLFDSLLVVGPGNIYVGWIQNSDAMLNIGVDRNTIATGNMYSFITGFWYQSQVPGAWMMRPLFGDTVVVPIGIKELQSEELAVEVHPNPASGFVSVVSKSTNHINYDYNIFNSMGALIFSGITTSGRINLNGLVNGFYFVRLTDLKSKLSVTKKLVVQHE